MALWTFNACLLVGLAAVLFGFRPAGAAPVVIYLVILFSSAAGIVRGWFRRRDQVNGPNEQLRKRYGAPTQPNR